MFRYQDESNPKGFEDDVTTLTMKPAEWWPGHLLTCDVTNAGQVKDLVETAADRFGRLDIMVNNAGVVLGGKLLHEFTEEVLDACYKVNVKGTFLGSRKR